MKFPATNSLPSFLRSKTNNDLIVKLICICWLVTKLVCYKLWLAYRVFPLVPVHDSLAGLPVLLHTGLFGVSLLCMALLVFFPGRKIAVVLLLAELISCMLDQNRWQPWEYQFVFMLAGYVFIRDEKKCRFSWQLIIVGLYFFSGLYKCSSSFIHNVWNHLFLQQFFGIHNAGKWLMRFGYVIPLVEIFISIALCFGRTRKLAVVLLLVMHLFNLVLFGPLGLNINSVIWAWNILMPLLAYRLFYKDGLHLFDKNLWKPSFAWLMLLAWWVLPWLQLTGRWDKYLSGVLYSGRIEQLYICTDNGLAYLQLGPCFVKSDKSMSCSTSLSVTKWAIQEMNTAPYPEYRVYKTIALAWNKLYPDPANRFYLYRAGFTAAAKPFLVDER